MAGNTRTFIMIKPDGVKRKLIGEIVSRFERKGLQLTMAKLMRINEELAARHYAHLREKPFFGELVEYITSGDVFAMVWEGPKAVELARQLIGYTDPSKADVGTIRGDYGLSVEANVVHGSDSDENAEVEIARFFG